MFKGALIGFGITLGLAAIPLVHFVTIWPAPFVGGFIGGSKAEADTAQALGIGLLMAAFMAVPLVGIIWSVNLFFHLFSGAGLVTAMVGVLTAYVALLGTLGALVGGSVTRRQRNT